MGNVTRTTSHHVLLEVTELKAFLDEQSINSVWGLELESLRSGHQGHIWAPGGLPSGGSV